MGWQLQRNRRGQGSRHDLAFSGYRLILRLEQGHWYMSLTFDGAILWLPRRMGIDLEVAKKEAVGLVRSHLSTAAQGLADALSEPTETIEEPTIHAEDSEHGGQP